ncbi:hypothetical protein ACFPM3_16490 [Streptomyces coeruleoprunus]|uniref:HEAT repeat domain-containing protein n=1 Tax=Streptomyces coeruleoprunus TaxID=285563 RepID=A0ABV9XHU8_9ACTN
MNPSEPDAELPLSLQDAGAASWSVRAAAGRHLATAAELPEVAEALHRLLLDAHDTAVTMETAEALLERRDTRGLRLVLGALTEADEDTGQELLTSLDRIHGRSWEDIARLRHLATELTSDADEAVAAEARGILGRLPSRGHPA